MSAARQKSTKPVDIIKNLPPQKLQIELADPI
jgi:hypothetical protein